MPAKRRWLELFLTWMALHYAAGTVTAGNWDLGTGLSLGVSRVTLSLDGRSWLLTGILLGVTGLESKILILSETGVLRPEMRDMMLQCGTRVSIQSRG